MVGSAPAVPGAVDGSTIVARGPDGVAGGADGLGEVAGLGLTVGLGSAATDGDGPADSLGEADALGDAEPLGEGAGPWQLAISAPIASAATRIASAITRIPATRRCETDLLIVCRV